MNLEQDFLRNKIQNMFEALMSLTPITIPVPPPDYLDFMALQPLAKQKMEYDGFLRIPHIHDYLEAKWKTQLYNRDSVIYLSEYLQSCPENQKQSYEIKIRQFLKFIIPQNKVFQALRLNFDDLKIRHLTFNVR